MEHPNSLGGDGAPATSVGIGQPSYLVVDGAGNLYIGDGNDAVIAKVTTDGVIHTIHGGHHQTAGPVGAQNAVAFQTAGDFAAEGEDRFGRLTLERVADGVVADRTDAFGQGPTAALGFDLQQARHLHGRPQKDRIEDFGPGVGWRVAALRHGMHQIRKAENLVPVGVEAVPGQAY
jgi:hypothetical protein